MTNILLLTFRVIHVLFAAVWVGSTVLMKMLVIPTAESSGPAGGQFMSGMNRKGVSAYFGVIGGVTVLTGIYLLWRFTGGFSPELSRSRGGMAFGIGGVAGIIALILGGSIVGRGSKKMVESMEKIGPMPDGPEKKKLLAETDALRKRVNSATVVVLVLQLIALTLMTLGHYI